MTLRTSVPLVAGLAASLLLVGLYLGPYWLHYYPYEDDFSLLRYSAVQYSPTPHNWITDGFSNYFANDPNCVTGNFGMVRPVANATQYLESMFYTSADGPLLMLTNVVCWVVSSCFIYGIVLRLGASRWLGSAALVLFALSPCWYRVLIHSAFRNNGITTGCLLATFYILLDKRGTHSPLRLLLAGGFLAMAAGAHEQALASIPILVLTIGWLDFQSDKTYRPKRMAAAIALVLLPVLLLAATFRSMNPHYGTSYASTGFLQSLSQSDRLTEMGIHSSLLVTLIKLPVKLFAAFIATLEAFTPFGPDNLAESRPIISIIIFVFVTAAVIATRRVFSALIFPVAIFFLFAYERNLAMPSSDTRFMQMEVAWGIILLMCLLSTAVTYRDKRALVTAALAVTFLITFEAVSFNDTIVARQSILYRRNEVDREAFRRIKMAAQQHPDARVILINDQAALWSSRAMLEMAGFRGHAFEILPTIGNWPSTDVQHDLIRCPVNADLKAFPLTLQIQVNYPPGCGMSTYGRDLACTVSNYRASHQPYAVAWSECLDKTINKGPCQPPLVHDVPREASEPLVVILWRSRLLAPDINIFDNQQNLPIATELAL